MSKRSPTDGGKEAEKRRKVGGEAGGGEGGAAGEWVLYTYWRSSSSYRVRIALAHKGRPTHHLIRKNEAGVFTINNKVFGQKSDLKEVCVLVVVGSGLRSGPIY